MNRKSLNYWKKYGTYFKEHLKARYNMTLDDYWKLFIQQKGKCWICEIHRSELETDLFVDHNHKTGKVRGLLCRSCNLALGSFKEHKGNLTRAWLYLELNN